MQLASCAADRFVKVWNVADGEVRPLVRRAHAPRAGRVVAGRRPDAGFQRGRQRDEGLGHADRRPASHRAEPVHQGSDEHRVRGRRRHRPGHQRRRQGEAAQRGQRRQRPRLRRHRRLHVLRGRQRRRQDDPGRRPRQHPPRLERPGPAASAVRPACCRSDNADGGEVMPPVNLFQ